MKTHNTATDYGTNLQLPDTTRSAIADKPRSNVGNLWQKQACRPNCEKRASNIALRRRKHFEMLNRLRVCISFDF